MTTFRGLSGGFVDRSPVMLSGISYVRGFSLSATEYHRDEAPATLRLAKPFRLAADFCRLLFAVQHPAIFLIGDTFQLNFFICNGCSSYPG
ncbi:hypothetical protein ACNKHU_22055 [Shigella flexneri]